ncbi:hypothetical protein FOYG_14792 [Fusarium oxysporum NRRL 32931]|uniref:Uncharacterized protein n=1 Tax=Fusarium oxysporum NRRL 32931 TaxID=660029 RepID=W9HJD3_FUSOX|nr:hypothetical protein FOYG_14792 [Fusarium oxysporum NRRL 32931]
MALQMHLSRAFSHVLVSLPRSTDLTPDIALQAFATPATSTITRHDAHTTKTDNDRRVPNDKRRPSKLAPPMRVLFTSERTTRATERPTNTMNDDDDDETQRRRNTATTKHSDDSLMTACDINSNGRRPTAIRTSYDIDYSRATTNDRSRMQLHVLHISAWSTIPPHGIVSSWVGRLALAIRRDGLSTVIRFFASPVDSLPLLMPTM